MKNEQMMIDTIETRRRTARDSSDEDANTD